MQFNELESVSDISPKNEGRGRHIPISHFTLSRAHSAMWLTQLVDHHCAADHLTHASLQAPAYNRFAGPSLICGYCVLCAPPRNPQPIICQNPADKEIWRRALQKSTSQRVPQIHLHKSTNRVARSNMFSEFCFAEYAADLKSLSSGRCQQTETDTHKIIVSWGWLVKWLYFLDDDEEGDRPRKKIMIPW